MKCFHFTNGEREELKEGGLGVSGVVSRSISKVSWARSLSIASSSSTSSTSFLQDIRKSSSTSTGFDSSDASNEDFLSFSQRRKDSCCNNVVNELKVFTYAELKSGTRGFSRSLVIGEGGFGCVYRGVVKLVNNEKLDVAIKQLNRSGFQGHKEWINEVNYLGVVKHPNLVKLVGYCAEDDERGMQRLLVYELMRNKSLEDHLLARIPAPLPWMARLKIAQDAARGLAHLHEEMNFQLIFRDFKTSNILIDEDFNAKLSDFGLARQGPAEGNSHVSTDVVGTVGYAAPEYVQTGKLTAKSDVWSFGVVLYELITGRRAVERNLPRGEQKLLEWAKPYASDPKKFYLILDPRLQGEDCLKSAKKLASLANKCLMKNPKSRPKMSEAVEILQNIIDETSSHDEDVSQQVEIEVAEEVKEEPADEGELTKPGNKYLKKVFDFREMVSLKNKSIGKLDWKNWTPGLLRT